MRDEWIRSGTQSRSGREISGENFDRWLRELEGAAWNKGYARGFTAARLEEVR